MAEIVTNTAETNNVRRETLQGREYLVVDVTAARADLKLNGGVVPPEEWQRSRVDWNRVPLPIGHPQNARGDFVTARLPEVLDNAVLGDFYYANYDEETYSLNGELWVDVEQAQSLGEYGQMVLDHIERDEPLEVSTAYRAEKGEPRRVNGEYYEEVRVNLRPDHLAVLPGDLGPGKCSVEDGCGTGNVPPEEPATNEAGFTTDGPAMGYVVDGEEGEMAVNVYPNMELNVLQQARTPEYSDTESSESAEGWERPSLQAYIQAAYNRRDGEQPDDLPSQVSDLPNDVKQWIAERSLLGDPDATTEEELISFPVVTPNNVLSEAAVRAARNRIGSADLSDQQESSLRNRTAELLEDEFDRDLDENAAENDDEGDGGSQEDSTGDGDSGSDESDEGSDPEASDEESPSTSPETNESDISASPASLSEDEQEGLSLLQRAFQKLGLGDPAAEAEAASTDLETEAGDCGCEGPEAETNDGEDETDTESESESDADADSESDGEESSGDGEDESDTGADTDADTNSPGDADTSTDSTMTDYDIEQIAAQTNFSEEELRDLSEDKLAKIAELANETGDEESSDEEGGEETDGDSEQESDDGGSEDGGSQEEPTDEGGDDQSGDEGVDETNDGLDLESMIEARVEDRLEEVLNDDEFVDQLIEDRLPDGIDEVAANHREERQQRRERQKNTILSNSDAYSEEMLEEMDDEALAATERAVKPSTGTDFGARPVESANADTGGSDDDNEGPATAGSLADYRNRSESD